MKETLRRRILSLGADVCGFAGMERFADAPAGYSPKDVWDKCRTVIAFGIALPKGLWDAPGRLIYGHFNSLSAALVDQLALKGAALIEKEFGVAAMPIPCDGPYEDWDAETMHGKGTLSMKHAAAACGLGRLGKSSLLLHPVYGNRLTLGLILTDIALPSDEMCKCICIPGCTRCMDACPAGAIHADGTVEQRKCRLKTYGKTSRGFDTVECRCCREICPVRFGE